MAVASPLLAGDVPADRPRNGTQAWVALSPRDLDRGQQSREHQQVGRGFRHGSKDHVLVIGAFDHADAAAGPVAQAAEPRPREAERAPGGAAAAEARCAAAERVGTRRRFIGDLPDGDLEGGLFDARVDHSRVGIEPAQVRIGPVVGERVRRARRGVFRIQGSEADVLIQVDAIADERRAAVQDRCEAAGVDGA